MEGLEFSFETCRRWPIGKMKLTRRAALIMKSGPRAGWPMRLAARESQRPQSGRPATGQLSRAIELGAELGARRADGREPGAESHSSANSQVDPTDWRLIANFGPQLWPPNCCSERPPAVSRPLEQLGGGDQLVCRRRTVRLERAGLG